jgi:hypothetical protein
MYAPRRYLGLCIRVCAGTDTSGRLRPSFRLYAVGRDGYTSSRRVGVEVPVGIIKVEHEVIFDVLWDIRDRWSMTKMCDIR